MSDDRELSEVTFWILTALAGGRRHGYAILQETVEASEQRVSLKVATLYAALERLSASGWVEADGDELVDGRTRRYFRLTDRVGCASRPRWSGSSSALDSRGSGCGRDGRRRRSVPRRDE